MGRGALSYGRVGLNIREARFVLQVGFDVFVASAAHGEHDHVIGLEGATGEEGEGVAAFESGDDAFEAGEFEGGTERFIIGDRQDGGAAGVGEVGKERADAGIVESGGDAVGFDHAAFGVLHDEGAAAVEDARATDVDGRGGATALYALPTGFSQDDAHAGRVEVVIDAAGGVGATADAGEEIVRIVAAFLCFELGFDFLADDALKTCHEVGIRMWADRRTDDVERVGRMRRPVGDGSVDGILERATATPDGANVGAEHFHAFHVDVLAFHIDGSHIDHAGHAHQRAGGSSGHAVLSGSSLGDDACFSKGSREEDLSDGVVDFVRPGVVEVFALEIDAGTISLAEASRMVEGTGASDVVAQEGLKFALERFAFDDFAVARLEFSDGGSKDFGDVGSAEAAVEAVGSDAVGGRGSRHGGKFF